MNFVKASLKHKQVTITILALVFAAGVYSLLTMPRREDPKVTIPAGLVVAYYPGATAAEVEEQVTRKLEQYLFQFNEVRKAKTFSTTRDGVVVVNVELNSNVKKPDIFWNKLRHQLLTEKKLDLPQGVIGPIVNTNFGETEALLIGIECKNASYIQLKAYAQKLEEQLRTIQATAKIQRIGEQKEQITISFDPEKLVQYGISLQQVIKVLQAQNAIGPTGNVKTENNDVSLYTQGNYTTETEIGNQIVGTSNTGSVIRLRDIATLKRGYAEPTSSITVDGHKALLIAVQMHEGYNIVKFGKEVKQKINEVSQLLPSDVKLTTIVNQPSIVDIDVSHFMREFLIAIGAVIVVIILLLPFRIAAVAATAIPMTISVTFALMHAFGVELHQVSLAALIVVLGMVVDDAIVVADNYVDLLDKGTERWTAAWHSAYDLAVPILTATITIIASFMPMLILKGAVGEFIHDLPVTVAIALASSFIVAMVLTPILCFVFIKKGLHEHSEDTETTKKKGSLLNIMQNGYNKALAWSMKHPVFTIGGSIVTILLAWVLFKTCVGQQFFPYAERNQFVVELWMPTGTKLDKTKQAISRIENLIKNDKRVVSYATFAGTSAPRVYYNFAPVFPVSNYAQILINTTSNATTQQLASELTPKVAAIVPEGTVQVKLMQQGQPLKSPVEVRIFGENIRTLKQIAGEVKAIIHHAKGNYLVRDDFKQDYYGIGIRLKPEAARLGFTTESIGQMVYACMSGVKISTLYEGDNAVGIVLRMKKSERRDSQDIENIYLESPVSGARVPLRQIADIVPEWHNGRIIHRNGVRCITVGSQTKDGILPSVLLREIRPVIAKLHVPPGYRLEYGGEYANKTEVFSQMITALGISLILIFLILLIQFRNVKESIIIMITIPLSLFGAILGLSVTGNNFGFTAFVGLISLSGIVVRNAIILVDHINELLEKGMDIRTAAIESGKRRLRPIFLTAMAAAIGVLPMILSGSSLWSPLASVIAFGVTWSMIMSLLTIPLLYSIIMKPKDKIQDHSGNGNSGPLLNKTMILIVLLGGISFTATKLKAQQTSDTLDLQKVEEMAVQNNRLLKIKQMQVNEKQQKINEDRVSYFPKVVAGANYQYNNNTPVLNVPQGSFGELPLGATTIALPSTDMTFDVGTHNTYNVSATFYQPVSQLPKIAAGVKISETELAIAKNDEAKTTMQIKQAAEKLYYGLLILQKQKEEAQLKLQAAKAKLQEVEGAVSAGKATASSQIGLNADVADKEQDLLKTTIKIDDYTDDLKHLIGLPDTSSFALANISVDDFHLQPIPYDTLLNEARAGNTDLQKAGLVKTKAEYAIRVSKYSYLPDCGIVGGYTRQEGNSLFPANNTFIGILLKWDLQSLFSDTYVKQQRMWMEKQAEENVANTQEQVHTDLAKAYRKLSQSEELISVARKVVEYRREGLKIQTDSHQSGLNTDSDFFTAKAELAKAEADLFSAQLNYRIAYTNLQIFTGRF